MKILKPVIGTAFFAGIIGMLLSVAALESGRLDGATYWVLVFSCAALSGGSLLAAKAAYKYEQQTYRRNQTDSGYVQKKNRS